MINPNVSVLQLLLRRRKRTHCTVCHYLWGCNPFTGLVELLDLDGIIFFRSFLNEQLVRLEPLCQLHGVVAVDEVIKSRHTQPIVWMCGSSHFSCCIRSELTSFLLVQHRIIEDLYLTVLNFRSSCTILSMYSENALSYSTHWLLVSSSLIKN